MIHPTAIVEINGALGGEVEIGPYAIIQGDITFGHGCRVAGHAQILNSVTLGDNCFVGPGAIIGADPQDLSFDPATSSGVRIGNNNIFREYVTIHRSARPGASTRLGNHNYLMSGCHIGHDTSVGDHNTIANNCLLAGIVTLGNHAFLGGGSVYHQFIRIGDFTMVRGNAGLGMDLAPFVIADQTNRVAGLNIVGLRRAGFDREVITEIRRAYHLCFRSGLNLSQALTQAEEESWNSTQARTFFDFLRGDSKRGFCTRLAQRD